MSVILYWIAIRFYSIAVKIAALFRPKAKLFVEGRKQLLTHIRYSLFDEKRPRIWMHCASLGEFEQGRPVLEKLKILYPKYAIIVTFFSPSGFEARKNYLGANYVFYLPLDSKRNASHFVESLKPSLAIFVKYELWYFFLMRLAAVKVPVVLVSAIFRPSQPFFKWYGKLHVKMLHSFSQIFVQDEASKKLLDTIDVNNVTVSGDTRFDRVASILSGKRVLSNMEIFCGEHKILVAGSTWAEDEALLKMVHDKLDEDWKYVIVPHEIGKEHIEQILEQYQGEAVLWSEFEKEYYDQRILVVDTVGQLLWLYKYAHVTYVGGGFNKSGIHNLLEAAVYGKPVFHGPIHEKFKEAVDLNRIGVAFATSEYESMVEKMILWETDRIGYNATCVSAKKYVLDNTGATSVITGYIQEKHFLTNS